MIGRLDPRSWDWRVRHYLRLGVEAAGLLLLIVLAYWLVFAVEPVVSEVFGG